MSAQKPSQHYKPFNVDTPVWQGLSSDTKPLPTRGFVGANPTITLPFGSLFIEMDTGRVFHWNDKEWVLRETPQERGQQALIAGQEALLNEIRKLNEQFAELIGLMQ